MTSAISSALSSYDNSSQVDSKIITALLDFYTRAEVDQAIADATSGSVDLSNYYTQAETQSYVANELLAYYPRTELDSQLTATFTQYTGPARGPKRRSTTPSPASWTRPPRTPATSSAHRARRAATSSTWSRSNSRPE